MIALKVNRASGLSYSCIPAIQRAHGGKATGYSQVKLPRPQGNCFPLAAPCFFKPTGLAIQNRFAACGQGQLSFSGPGPGGETLPGGAIARSIRSGRAIIRGRTYWDSNGIIAHPRRSVDPIGSARTTIPTQSRVLWGEGQLLRICPSNRTMFRRPPLLAPYRYDAPLT